MRDWHKIICALEAKANDRACPPAESELLMAKAKELRAIHGDPVVPRSRPLVPLVMWTNTGTTSGGYVNVTITFG